MRYSIIIPVYNAERTIADSLKSVQNQTFEDFEAIMIDDGSTDLSGEICQNFALSDHRFNYIRQSNQGVSAARNKGLQEAQGDYIVFLDSDDEYAPAYLVTFETLMNQLPDYDHYWCGFQIKSDVSSRNGKIYICSEDEEISVCQRKNIMTLHEMWLDSTLWNKVFRREIIRKENLRMDTELSLGEDLLFNYQYLEAAGERIAIVNSPNYVYCQSGNNSLDSKYRENLRDIYEYLDAEILKWLTRWEVSEYELSKYFSSVFYMQEKILRNTFRAENQAGVLKKYRFNRDILNSVKFEEALERSNCFVHPLYRFAYRSKLYLLVQLIDLLVKVKGR